jgi:hypothetical protein
MDSKVKQKWAPDAAWRYLYAETRLSSQTAQSGMAIGGVSSIK